MGETFGHVVPGIFYSLIAIILLILTRSSARDAPSLSLGRFDFSRQAKRNLGLGMLLTCSFGIAIEGIGGVLHNGDFLFQIAHESMYFGFAMAGLACILESSGKLPRHTWRAGLCMGFFVEGLVFYGHALEQRGVERMLHMIMVFFSWLTSASFLVCCLLVAYPSRSRAVLVTHCVGLAVMLGKGLWFFVIADILYSGKFGEEGKAFMIADAFVYAGLLLVSLFAFVGGFLLLKPSGAAYLEEEEEEEDDETAGAARDVEKSIPISQE